MSYLTKQIIAGLTVWLYSTGCQIAFASTIAVNPGAYEITAETLLPHLEENLRYATTRSNRCLGTQDASSLFPVLTQKSFVDCSLIGTQNDREYSDYSLVCRNSEAATGSARFIIRSSGFYGLLEVKMGGKNMRFSQRINGYRSGACDNGK